MTVRFTLNGEPVELDVPTSTTLLSALRRELAIYGVKHGCETGECGACTVNMNGRPVNSCVMLAVQAEGAALRTVESLGEHPEQGWRTTGVSGCQKEDFLIDR